MDKHYDEMINSKVADVENLGKNPREAGSITAAQFLGRFIKPETKWAHLDILSTTFLSEEATGFGIRLLDEFTVQNYGVKD